MMDWPNEPWLKLYTRVTVDDAVLSWQARALWSEIIRRLDRAGVMDFGRHRWRGVAILVSMPIDIVESAGAELLDDGRLIEREGCLVSPNFSEAQEARASDKARQRESRRRRREVSLGTIGNVTDGHSSSPPVTKRDNRSQNVTIGHKTSQSVTNRIEENRIEENRIEENRIAHSPAPAGAGARAATPKSEVTAADIDAVYAEYPLKKGKAVGIAKARKTIRTRADYEKFRDCAAHMATAFASDTSYCPHFSTFVFQRLWLDDEWPGPRKDARPIAKGRAEPREYDDYPEPGVQKL